MVLEEDFETYAMAYCEYLNNSSAYTLEAVLVINLPIKQYVIAIEDSIDISKDILNNSINMLIINYIENKFSIERVLHNHTLKDIYDNKTVTIILDLLKTITDIFNNYNLKNVIASSDEVGIKSIFNNDMDVLLRVNIFSKVNR